MPRKPEAVPPRSELFSSAEKRTPILCLLLIVATLGVYNSVKDNAFVNFDDDFYIVNNPHVQQGLTWETVRWAFATYDQANWHPLTWLSHALDCQLFQLNPAGSHYVNVMLHAASVVLLFLLLQGATGKPWRSLCVAALFALHPLNVESVAWAAERKNVLSMLFLLLALLAYDRYARQPSVLRYGMVVASFALGLMAKPQIITLPFVLLLWDYWPLGRLAASSVDQPVPAQPLSRLILEKVPLFLLSAASAAVTLRAQTAGGAVRTSLEYPFSLRLGNAVVAYARYFGKAIWPSHLAVMYPHPGNSLPAWQIALAAVLLLTVTVLVVLARRQRYLATGWFWFLGTLVPMVGLVQVGGAAMADRYAYIPFIGLFVMVVWGTAELARAWRIPAAPMAAAAAILLLALSVVTYGQVQQWRDSETLWSHALAVTDRNFVAHDNLGSALINQGRIEEAIGHFRTAIAIRPDDPVGHLYVGTYDEQRGSLPDAIQHMRATLRFTADPSLRERAYANLGSAYRNLEDYQQARECFDAALHLNPANPMAMVGVGLIAQKNGDFPEAIRRYSQAVAVQPNAVGYLLLAKALQQSARFPEAAVASDQARLLAPDLDAAQQAVSQLLAH